VCGADGHHAESVLVGLALTAALLPRKEGGGNFPQQIDPFTAIPETGDGCEIKLTTARALSYV